MAGLTRHFCWKSEMMIGIVLHPSIEESDLPINLEWVRHVSIEQLDEVCDLHPVAVSAVMDLLNSCDLQKIAFAGEIEYYPEAVDIVANLDRCNTVDEVVQLVQEVFVYWFSQKNLDNVSVEMIPAAEILSVKKFLHQRRAEAS